MKGKKVLATYFRGKNQIEGIWAIEDIDCPVEIFIPLWSGIGYHRDFVVDIMYEVLIG